MSDCEAVVCLKKRCDEWMGAVTLQGEVDDKIRHERCWLQSGDASPKTRIDIVETTTSYMQ